MCFLLIFLLLKYHIISVMSIKNILRADGPSKKGRMVGSPPPPPPSGKNEPESTKIFKKFRLLFAKKFSENILTYFQKFSFQPIFFLDFGNKKKQKQTTTKKQTNKTNKQTKTTTTTTKMIKHDFGNF